MTGDIGWAVTEMKFGAAVRREAWKGLALCVTYVPASAKGVGPPRDAYLQMFASDRSCVPWTPSQAEILATDWVLAS